MLYRAFDMTITDQTTNEVMRLFRPLTCQVRSFIFLRTADVLFTQMLKTHRIATSKDPQSPLAASHSAVGYECL